MRPPAPYDNVHDQRRNAATLWHNAFVTPVEIADGSRAAGKDTNDGVATKATAAGELKPVVSMLEPGSAAETVDGAFPEPGGKRAQATFRPKSENPEPNEVADGF